MLEASTGTGRASRQQGWRDASPLNPQGTQQYPALRQAHVSLSRAAPQWRQGWVAKTPGGSRGQWVLETGVTVMAREVCLSKA